MTLFCVVSMIMVKKTELVGVPCVWTLFIGGGYCKKSFPFMAANISAHVVVRGVVTSSRNVRQLWMCLLVLLLEALVGYWWCDEDFSCVWKCEWPFLVTLASSTLIQFFVMCLMLKRFLSKSVYKLSYKKIVINFIDIDGDGFN
jgi:hypothetical protein